METTTCHTLVLGGIRSGKTGLAEAQALAQPRPVVYLATATAGDVEMASRISRHQASRPGDWGLVEEPLHLGQVLWHQGRHSPAPCLLIDCMSLWVSNLLHAGDELFRHQRDDFLQQIEAYPGPLVVVSNETGLGTVGMDPLTRRFCDEMGWLNQMLAQRCDRVLMAVAGLPLVLKDQAAAGHR
ncbi:bifunctional adenosylcobinamide kinase/adenosylcobinamide-phosphate guanylyltransferase [Marinobacter sp. X15-166B]|uniref:bifunctional adenosylcobinamide kinase/adenosylcobinamide-phosphate guanylyltransferase n=1 Tax=Marinobacter sp. X15-166B TaxID=1897620 RepID=UPI00085BED1E|nr:bifunctional adenosylcobinamide kinase/adenosylcobinamide-phosphate guanylyltransferase [Marinobacter sp. X15-166B]OEY66232.1 bifunctional adenosylcobinamide kinase/adenosylcobinamide-phosphate guanylyltransferase [Marinobacter sp. X15-166B]